MSDGTVSASPATKSTATQLQGYVNGDLPAALQKLLKLATQLENDTTFKGKYADDYHSQAYPGIQKSTKQMQGDLQTMSKSLSNIVANILSAGGN